MSDHDRLGELAKLSPLGGLDRDDQAELDRHLSNGCDRCEASLARSQQLLGPLFEVIDPISPRPTIKDALLAQARNAPFRGGPPVESLPKRPQGRGLLAAALVVIATALGFYAQSLRNTTESLTRALENERQARQLAESASEAAQARVAALTAPGATVVSLGGQAPAAGARARAFLDATGRRLILYAYDLPAPPLGHTYQLWVIVDGMPVSAGTFEVGPDGSALHEADVIPDLDSTQTVSLAVTIEPDGGVPQPSGAMVLVDS